MSDFVTKEELEGIIEEVRKDVNRIENRLSTLESALASPDILRVAEKILQFALDNSEQLSKEKLYKLSKEAARIGELGEKIRRKINH